MTMGIFMENKIIEEQVLPSIKWALECYEAFSWDAGKEKAIRDWLVTLKTPKNFQYARWCTYEFGTMSTYHKVCIRYLDGSEKLDLYPSLLR